MRICPQCGKEFKPVNDSHIYCAKQCRYDFNNALKAKPENDENRVYSQLHGISEIEIIERLERKIDKLSVIIERQQATIELMAMQQATTKKSEVSHGEVLPSIPQPKPLVINPEEMPLIEVKKSENLPEKDAGQEFKNSILSLLG